MMFAIGWNAAPPVRWPIMGTGFASDGLLGTAGVGSRQDDPQPSACNGKRQDCVGSPGGHRGIEQCRR